MSAIQSTPALVLAALLPFCACTGGLPGASALAPTEGRSAEAVPVRAERPQVGDVAEHIEANAELEALGWADVPARVAGQVVEVAAEVNDRVQAGQVLARLAPEEFALRVEDARHALAQAQGRARQAEVAEEEARADSARTERQRELLPADAVERSRFAALRASAALDVARAEAARSQVALDLSERDLDLCAIRAPIAGVVARREVRTGAQLVPHTVAFRVVDTARLVARLRVPQRDVARVQPGQVARVYTEATGETPVEGRLEVVSPVVDPATGTLELTVRVPDTGGRLRPGMFGRVRLVTQVHTGALLVPKEAVVLEGARTVVYAVREGKAVAVPIRTGLSDERRVEVLPLAEQGPELGPSDLVVVVGQSNLRPGGAVRVIE